MAVKEFLDTDRVNFLIWRYLLEGNYRETAAKFQKEWGVQEPHRNFDFARHVQSHALVSIINRGLLYYAIERECGRNQFPQHSASAASSSQFGVFGPLTPPPTTSQPHPQQQQQQPLQLPQSPKTPPRLNPAPAPAPPLLPPALPPPSALAAPAEDEDDKTFVAPGPAVAPLLETAEDTEAPRKRALQQMPNGSPAKRPRLINGFENGDDGDAPAAAAPTTTAATTTTTTVPAPAPSTTTPMDIDPSLPSQTDMSQHDAVANGLAYPSPLEGEQLPPPTLQTEGPEQGTQVEKVEELEPVTAFIGLADANDGTDTTPSPSPAGAENAPVLLQCEWNPRDPAVLAAAGTDALAHVWTVSRATAAPEPGGNPPSPQRTHALLEPNTPRSTTVTALSWTADGTSLAIAIDSLSKAAVSIWSMNGAHTQSLELDEPPVIKLCWNPAGSALLAISPEKNGGVVTIISMPAYTSTSFRLPRHDIAATPLDAAWTSDTDFLLGGGDLLMCLHHSGTSITETRKFDTRPDDDGIVQILFDWRSKLVATSSDKGILDLWDEPGQRRSISAHQGAITSMAWQPLPPGQPQADDERLIATGGDDCAILIWNARKPDSKAAVFLTMDSPIVRLAFTPDGAFIAGATTRQVLIWQVDSHAMPRASWNRPPHPGWLSPKGSSESDEEDEHCLCWDMSGQHLAYGSNSRLAVIKFSR